MKRDKLSRQHYSLRCAEFISIIKFWIVINVYVTLLDVSLIDIVKDVYCPSNQNLNKGK